MKGRKRWLWWGLALVAGAVAFYFWWKSDTQIVNRLYKYELGHRPDGTDFTGPAGGSPAIVAQGNAAYASWTANIKAQGGELGAAKLLHTYSEAVSYRAGKFPTRPPYTNHYGLGA